MVTHPIQPISIKCWTDFLKKLKEFLFDFFIDVSAGQKLVIHQSACLDISATKLLWKLMSRSPMPLAFLWLSRRHTFYKSLVFPYQVLLRSTLFNTLHMGLVLTTCQQIRWWLLLSFQFLLTTLSLVKILPRKNWNPSHHGNGESHPLWVLYSWRIPLITSVGSKLPSSSKMSKKSNECGVEICYLSVIRHCWI